MDVDVSVKYRNGGYWVVVHVDGKFRDRTGPFQSLSEAKVAADDLLRMLASVTN